MEMGRLCMFEKTEKEIISELKTMSSDRIISLIVELSQNLNEHEKLEVVKALETSADRDSLYYPSYEQFYCITEDTAALAEEAYLEWLENLPK